ncbi:hypothetical protein H696_02087 [Fonticula alba]|uniref:NADH dehydrogenase (Ubiquinone) 1 alpha subcomplex 6 n=1 Tax=Fonticula alba TaxID=691883 RepID=A0A058ZB27_FONAL|nr:hypothetical protein H696_02087 [Fonticula alba]KCV71136.1 hypothetical protein H696_02087 [Fonticula alba]|eukprot:XP_009494259.1 hypothetical protein H696_02087 [Fonticula alba]
MSNRFVQVMINPGTATAAEVSAAARTLYRNWNRNLPLIAKIYELDMPLPYMRAKIREEFDRVNYVTDVPARALLVYKGQLHLEETMNIWNQKTNIMRFFERPSEVVIDPARGGFLTQFFDGQRTGEAPKISSSQ